LGSDTKSDRNEINISSIDIKSDHLAELDFETYKVQLDKQFDEKKNTLLKNITFSKHNTINTEDEEEKFKEEALHKHNTLISEEESKFQSERAQSLKELEEKYQKRLKKECEELKNKINIKTAEGSAKKKTQNELLKEKIKFLENQTNEIKAKVSKKKVEEQERALAAAQANNHEEDLAKAEAEAKHSLREFTLKKENEFKLKKQALINDYDTKILEMQRNHFTEETNQLSQSEINEVNHDFKDKKQSLLLDNEERINRAKDEIIDFYSKLLNEEKLKMQTSLQDAIDSLRIDYQNIQEYYQNQLDIYSIENEISVFCQVPNKIMELTSKNNEMFLNLSNFNKLIFDKLYKELENNKEFSKLKNKEKIYKMVFEYFSTLIFHIILEYSINENKELKELLDKLIDRIAVNMDKILFNFPVDRRVQLSIELKDTNCFGN